MIGPLVAGFVVQHLGFQMAFYVFASVAAAAAVLFLGFMPETRPACVAAIAPPFSLPHPSSNGTGGTCQRNKLPEPADREARVKGGSR